MISARDAAVPACRTRRSRSPSHRASVPRLSLPESDDLKPSPRTPLSPRTALSEGAVPATPRGPPNPVPSGSGGLGASAVKISPRFGTPRDENSPGNTSSNNSKRRGSTLSAKKGTGQASASALGSSRRPNPLLGGSSPAKAPATSAPPPAAHSSPSQQLNLGGASATRLSCVSDSSAESGRGSEYFSGPSLAGETTSFGAHHSSRGHSRASLTPCTSSTSLVVGVATHGMYGYGRSLSAGAAGVSRRGSAGAEQMGTTSLRSLAESVAPHGGASHRPSGASHPRGSVAMADEVEGDSELFGGSAYEQVEALCDKAQRIVRQLGACSAAPSSWEPTVGAASGAAGPPWSSRSSPQPGRGASPRTPPAHPCTGGVSPCSRSSPPTVDAAGATARESANALPIGGSSEDFRELNFRISQIEQVLLREREARAAAAASADEVLMLKGQLHAVQKDMGDVRGELREARSQISLLMRHIGIGNVDSPLAGGGSLSSRAPLGTARSSSGRGPSPGAPKVDAFGEKAGYVTPVPPMRPPLGGALTSMTMAPVTTIVTSVSPRTPRPPQVVNSPQVGVRMPYTMPAGSSTPIPQSGRVVQLQDPGSAPRAVPQYSLMAGTPPTTARVNHVSVQSTTGHANVQGASTSWRTVPWRMTSA